MNPLFSIIVPAYNVAGFVETAINSCLSQINIKRSEFEIIVINDGSTDNTLAILEKFRSISNVRILTQNNSGLSATRNRGIRESVGDYILFLDGDDWLTGDALYKLKEHISEADMILFSMAYYFPGEKTLNNSLGLKNGYIYTPKELLRETIGKSKFQSCPAPTKCYSSKLLKDNGISFIEGILHEDGPFYLECLSKTKTIKYIEEYLYCYRQQRSGSITTVKRSWRNVEGIIKGQKHVLGVYGYKNKDVNYYCLSTSVLQMLHSYNTQDDYNKVINYFSNFEVKRFLMNLIFKSRFDLKTFILGILIIISPSITGKLYSLKHKENVFSKTLL